MDAVAWRADASRSAASPSRHVVDSSYYQRPANVPAHIGAGGVVARVRAGRVYVGLVGEGGPWGFILPKGRVEPGESLEEAARREIEEEAGLTALTLLRELGVRERLNFRRTAWKTTHYFLFLTRQARGYPTDRAHDYRLHWFPLDGLPEMLWPEQRALIEEHRADIRAAALAAAARPGGPR